MTIFSDVMVERMCMQICWLFVDTAITCSGRYVCMFMLYQQTKYSYFLIISIKLKYFFFRIILLPVIDKMEDINTVLTA